MNKSLLKFEQTLKSMSVLLQHCHKESLQLVSTDLNIVHKQEKIIKSFSAHETDQKGKLSKN
jgi:hypothetical protein